MSSLSDKIYECLTDADSGNKSDHPNGSHTPENFVRLLLARTASKIGDRLSSPKTTLAWLLQSLGAPAVFAGLIVPIRESGSLLPQFALGNFLKRYKRRKWAWSIGSALQGAAIGGCSIVALTLEGVTAGIGILTLITLFSLARGICSVSAKDVLGKTIPKSKRGQLTGWASSTSGVIAIASAGFLLFSETTDSSRAKYAGYLGGAAMLWWLAALINAGINEPESDTERTPKSLKKGLRNQIDLLRSDKTFRDFLIVRSMAIGSGLSTPFIITLAHKQLNGEGFWLGIFIAVEGFAALVSSPLWGRAADRCSKSVLRLAMLTTFLVLLVTLSYAVLVPDSGGMAGLMFPLILFCLGVAHAGVRVGRKTYIVDIAEGDKRTDYVSVGNTLIGVLLLLVGTATGLASLISIHISLLVFAVCALVGAIYGHKLSPAH